MAKKKAEKAPDRLARLQSMQELVAASILAADPDKRAPLVNQWRALEQTIHSLSEPEKKGGSVDPVDEVAARRAARGGATARARRASQQG